MALEKKTNYIRLSPVTHWSSLTPQTNFCRLLNSLPRPTSTPYYLPSQTNFRSLLHCLPKPTQLVKCEVVICGLILHADTIPIPINDAQRQAQRHGQADRDNAHHLFQGPWPVWYEWHPPVRCVCDHKANI